MALRKPSCHFAGVNQNLDDRGRKMRRSVFSIFRAASAGGRSRTTDRDSCVRSTASRRVPSCTHSTHCRDPEPRTVARVSRTILKRGAASTARTRVPRRGPPRGSCFGLPGTKRRVRRCSCFPAGSRPSARRGPACSQTGFPVLYTPIPRRRLTWRHPSCALAPAARWR
jgi:hypothetical protein